MSAGLALALAAVATAADPRPELVELRFTGRTEAALARAEAVQAADPEAARRWGIDYLRGHLLELLGRPMPAAEAFAQAMGNTPALEPYGRYRLACNVERRGHPEVAAGLIATVVADPPRHLAAEAAELFQRTLAAGGDCRLLRGVAPSRLADAERRLIELAAGDCALRDGDSERARALYLRLLAEAVDDDPGRLAAERLDALHRRDGGPPDEEEALLLGAAFHQHRRFDRALAYLEPVIEGWPESLGDGRFEVAYTAARSRFWREEFPAAVAAFGALAGRTSSRSLRAKALYQHGRALELSGHQRAADDAFRRAYSVDRLGGWASSALFAALRVEWRHGDEQPAGELYDALLSQRRWNDTAARASLFLAASDLVRGRSDRAGHWLDLAERAGRAVAIEAAYWRGRLAELEGEPDAAVRRYLQALRSDPHHPLAEAARERLAVEGLSGPARAEGTRLAASARSDDLYSAWLLLDDDSPWGRAALGRLRKRWKDEGAAAPLDGVEAVPPASWPLWRQPLNGPEEMLLALGVWEDGAPAVGEHFPLSSPELAFTSAALLARSGRTRPSIRIVEILAQRLPSRLPPAAHPIELRRLLYPIAHADQVVTQALEHNVDPYLLAAIIREESRFDERALSAASARGLTQFVHPTAVRVGRGIGFERLAPDDLYRPEVSIALGAAHLGELTRRFRGADHMVVAAYNAGEAQALLWRSYCFSPDPAEYFTKVNFTETRGYLEKVLRSRAHYREVYGDRRTGPVASPPN
jgi:soluble lytic murein transglycosylase